MKIRHLAVCLLIFTSLGTACTSSPSLESDEAAIRALIRTVEQANNEGNVDSWVNAFDEPFLYMGPYAPVVSDRDALRDLAESGFTSWRTTISIDPQQITIDGNWASVWSEVRGMSVSPDLTDTSDVNVKQLVNYRRTDQGWKISRLMINANEWNP